jgi:uncharacterized protein YggE
MKGKAGIFVAVVALGALLLTACGSETKVITDKADTNGISVQGQGIAYGSPDVADIDIGVQAQARDVSEARGQAAQTMDAVNKAIKANGVADADIRTTQFSVDPRYSSGPPPANTQTIVGYTVTNVVTVRIRKLDTVGKVVDDATAAGGNNTVIRRMQFGILDQTKLQAEARMLAVKDARDRGDKLAQLNNVKLGKPQQINESLSGGGPIPLAAPQTGASVARSDFQTTIETGQLRVVVNVSISYTIE